MGMYDCGCVLAGRHLLRSLQPASCCPCIQRQQCCWRCAGCGKWPVLLRHVFYSAVAFQLGPLPCSSGQAAACRLKQVIPSLPAAKCSYHCLAAAPTVSAGSCNTTTSTSAHHCQDSLSVRHLAQALSILQVGFLIMTAALLSRACSVHKLAHYHRKPPDPTHAHNAKQPMATLSAHRSLLLPVGPPRLSCCAADGAVLLALLLRCMPPGTTTPAALPAVSLMSCGQRHQPDRSASRQAL